MGQIYQFIYYVYLIYFICIFAWVLISWLPMLSPQLAYNSNVLTVRRFLDSVVEPYIRLFRFIPPVRMGGSMLDLSALAAILAYQILGGYLLLPLLKNVLGAN